MYVTRCIPLSISVTKCPFILGFSLEMRTTVNKGLKREYPRRPRGMTKMWHMLENIFYPEIPMMSS